MITQYNHWLLPVFQVLGNLPEISSSCSFNQFLSNKLINSETSPCQCSVCIPFSPVFPGFAFAKWRSFVFQSGKVTGSESGGVIDLTLDEEDDGASQGRWQDFPSCRGSWATSSISSLEWQKGINICSCLVCFIPWCFS